MLRLRTLLVGLALVAPTFTSVLAAPAPACAGETGPHAALVVDTGRTVGTYCVALGGPSVDGLELIRLAGRQHGLSYSFGFGGQAVCSLAGVGVDGSDCFASYPEYWGYWRGNGSGGWSWSSVGAASVSVGDGDIEGWSWGTGDTGSTHPVPPRTAFEDICEPDEDPTGGGGGGSGGGDGDPGEGPGAGGSSSAGSSPSPSQKREPKERARRTPSASVTPSAAETVREAEGPDIRAAGPSNGRSDDPPPALYLALVAAAALVGGGWLRLRGRGVSP